MTKVKLERDSCKECLKMKKDKRVNGLGHQMYCSSYHAFENLPKSNICPMCGK